MTAVYKPAGDTSAGSSWLAGGQSKSWGITQQYQLAGTQSTVDTSTGITPYDSGSILGTVPPGKPGLKLVSGVIQRAHFILGMGPQENFVPCSQTNIVASSAGNLNQQPPAGSQPGDGLSLAPNRE